MTYRCDKCGDVHSDFNLMPPCLMREMVGAPVKSGVIASPVVAKKATNLSDETIADLRAEVAELKGRDFANVEIIIRQQSQIDTWKALARENAANVLAGDRDFNAAFAELKKARREARMERKAWSRGLLRHGSDRRPLGAVPMTSADTQPIRTEGDSTVNDHLNDQVKDATIAQLTGHLQTCERLMTELKSALMHAQRAHGWIALAMLTAGLLIGWISRRSHGRACMATIHARSLPSPSWRAYPL